MKTKTLGGKKIERVSEVREWFIYERKATPVLTFLFT